jgi:hypothetical protein
MGASGLPRMDLVGSADPYFVAKLDDKISFVFVLIPCRHIEDIDSAVAQP